MNEIDPSSVSDCDHNSLMMASNKAYLGRAAAVHNYHTQKATEKAEGLNRKIQGLQSAGKTVPKTLITSRNQLCEAAKSTFEAGRLLGSDFGSPYAERANQMLQERPEEINPKTHSNNTEQTDGKNTNSSTNPAENKNQKTTEPKTKTLFQRLKSLAGF